MTSKGQVTIPADVRRRMGLGSGDRIEFVEQACDSATPVVLANGVLHPAR
nr:AbrB/MazE/SpoVT family DNA-binding domain-containing protein [Candidatus Accumulibacter sp. ACC003]